MTGWFASTVSATGRLPLFLFATAFLLAFGFIRGSTLLIRAQVRWWPGNITAGGVHIHHMVFGVIAVAASGLGMVATTALRTPITDAVLASVFGVGCALLLDEFALILHLRDVYWEREGRVSVYAVGVAFGITVLFLVGFHPMSLDVDLIDADRSRHAMWLSVAVIVLTCQFVLAAVTVLKGRTLLGLVGLFVPPLLFIGALRRACSGSPWWRWRNRSTSAAVDRSSDHPKQQLGPDI